MTVFLDTDILLDVLAKREPFFKDSMRMFDLCESARIKGAVSALSLCTLAYVLRKSTTQSQMKNTLRALRNVLNIVDTSGNIINRAIDSALSDFEDAVQFFSAVHCGADYIVTRNVKHFPSDTVPALTPAAFLALRQGQ
jgi:hypothetical protein